MAGEVMYQYLQQTNPDAEAGSIKVAMLETHEITPMMEKATGMEDSVASHEEFNVVYTSDSLKDLVDDGYTQAENALTYDPEISYIFVQNCIPTLGVCNYISGIPNVNYDDYNVFCTGEDDTTRELYEMTEAGEASLRGTVQSDKNEGEYMQDLLRMAITGEAVAPYELKFVFAAITAGWDLDYTSADVDQSLNPFAA